METIELHYVLHKCMCKKVKATANGYCSHWERLLITKWHDQYSCMSLKITFDFRFQLRLRSHYGKIDGKFLRTFTLTTTFTFSTVTQEATQEHDSGRTVVLTREASKADLYLQPIIEMLSKAAVTLRQHYLDAHLRWHFADFYLCETLFSSLLDAYFFV